MTARRSGTSEVGLGGFARRVALALLMVGGALAMWRLAGLIIIVFGSVLMAIGLRAVSRTVGRVARIGNGASLAVAVGGLLGATILVLWLFGSIIAGQIDELKRLVPAGLTLSAHLIETNGLARFAVEQARGLDVADMTAKAAVILAGAVRWLASALVYAAVMLVVAIYLAAQPALYRDLLVKAVPPGQRDKMIELLDRAGRLLRRWLVGQTVVMAAIGVMSTIGLWMLGIDAPLALGLLSGTMSFVPYAGTVLSAVPAILVALNAGPLQVVWVLALYVGVHFVEGDIMTPLVQAEATALPPVVSLVSLIVFGVLFGPVAVLLAAPLALFCAVCVQTLYIEPMNGRPGPVRPATTR